MVKSMYMEAGVTDHKTNHSLRATSATQLYKKEAPEKLTQEQTDHRSLEALRVYEWTSFYQHEAVSNLSSTSTNTHYMQIDLAGATTQQHVPISHFWIYIPEFAWLHNQYHHYSIVKLHHWSHTSVQSVVDHTEHNTVVNNWKTRSWVEKTIAMTNYRTSCTQLCLYTLYDTCIVYSSVIALF